MYILLIFYLKNLFKNKMQNKFLQHSYLMMENIVFFAVVPMIASIRRDLIFRNVVILMAVINLMYMYPNLNKITIGLFI